MDCPVCTAVVEDFTPKNYRGLVVRCRRCGVYRVMETAVAALRFLKGQHRLAALSRARKLVSARSLPTISNACF